MIWIAACRDCCVDCENYVNLVAESRDFGWFDLILLDVDDYKVSLDVTEIGIWFEKFLGVVEGYLIWLVGIWNNMEN